MILPSVTSLSMHVLDRGVPSKECIAMRAQRDVDMGQYALLLGYRDDNGLVHPYRDLMLWFGDGQISQGDWVFAYTGSGTSAVQPTSDGKAKIYSVFWGREFTVLADSRIVPVLIEVGAVTIADAPTNVPQPLLVSQER